MPADSPTVSLVLLCHNRPEPLEAALRSVDLFGREVVPGLGPVAGGRV